MKFTKAKSGTQNGPGFLHKIQKRFTRETKMSPRGPSGASKSLFKNLKKHIVFTRFWVQRPPKKTSRKKRAKKTGLREAFESIKNVNIMGVW